MIVEDRVDVVRALSFTQPWCGLVASGLKLVDNRPRQIVRREDFGVPFAVHASRKFVPEVHKTIRAIAPELQEGPAASAWHPRSRVMGAILAVATIVRVVTWLGGDPRSKTVVDVHTGEGVDLGDHARWFFGPFGYVLSGVRPLAMPVHCSGLQCFWHLSDEDRAAVHQQLVDGEGAS